MSKNVEVAMELTKNVTAGCYIVYTYNDANRYLENAFSFIKEGIEQDQIVIYVGYTEQNEMIQTWLEEAGYSKEQIGNIIIDDTHQVYGTRQNFDINYINERVNKIFGPYLHEDKIIRAWGQGIWKEQNPQVLCSNISNYEKERDKFVIDKSNIITVCAYDAKTMPSELLNELLQTHEYHMTDILLSRSHFYKKKPFETNSIFEQIKLDETVENEKIRSEKLSMASGIAANIAHELHNSLASMSGALQIVKATNFISDTNQKYFEIFDNQIKKVEQLASGYLALAQPHSENRKEVNVMQLVADVTEEMYDQAKNKNINIHLQIDSQDIMVLCDDMKMRQVFSNIIQNAIEVMEEGTIKIEVKNYDSDVYIYVIDNGPGIPENIMNQLGEPFMTTKENGTGLGLLIAEKITTDHSGKLIIDSEVGVGTTCTIYLPKI